LYGFHDGFCAIKIISGRQLFLFDVHHHSPLPLNKISLKHNGEHGISRYWGSSENEIRPKSYTIAMNERSRAAIWETTVGIA